MAIHPPTSKITMTSANWPPSGNITIANTNGISYSTATTANWTSTKAKVNITDGDIIMDGVSLRDTIIKIQDRLAILQPRPEHLKQFEALKQAYDHYKMLEALCCPTENADK